MKIFLLLSFFTLFSMTAFAKHNHFCKPQSFTSCRFDYALICPNGYVDGCLTGETSLHQCVSKNEGPLCELEIAILCPTHFRDGCELGTTSTHECVPVPGPSCDRNVKWECPSGFVDACKK
jgi:hypothetical protein